MARMEKVWLVDRWQETGYELGSSTEEKQLPIIEQTYDAIDRDLKRIHASAYGKAWVEAHLVTDGEYEEEIPGHYAECPLLAPEDMDVANRRIDTRMRQLAGLRDDKRELTDRIAAAKAQRRAEFVAKFARSPEYDARLTRSLANAAAQSAIDNLQHMDDHAQRRDKGQPDEACLTAICPGSRVRVAIDEARPDAEFTAFGFGRVIPPQPGQQAPEARDARARQDAGDGEGLNPRLAGGTLDNPETVQCQAHGIYCIPPGRPLECPKCSEPLPQGVQGNCLTHGVYFTPYCSECIGTPRSPILGNCPHHGAYAAAHCPNCEAIRKDNAARKPRPWVDPAPHAARAAGTPYETVNFCASHGPWIGLECPNCELNRKLRAVEDETARLKREADAEKRRIDDEHQATENARFARDKFWTERGKDMYAENKRLREQLDRVNIAPTVDPWRMEWNEVTGQPIIFCCDHGGIGIGREKGIYCPSCQCLKSKAFKAEDVCGVGVLKYEPPAPTDATGDAIDVVDRFERTGHRYCVGERVYARGETWRVESLDSNGKVKTLSAAPSDRIGIIGWFRRLFREV